MDDTINPYAAPQAESHGGANPARHPAPEVPIELTVTLTRNDWRAYHAFWQRREIARPLPVISVLALASLWLAVLITLLAVARDPFSFSSGAALALLIAMLFHLGVSHLRQRRAIASTGDGVFLGRHRFVFSAEGIRDESAHCDSLTRWAVVSGIEQDDQLIILTLSQLGAFVLPTRYVDNAPRLVADLNALRRRARATTSSP